MNTTVPTLGSLLSNITTVANQHMILVFFENGCLAKVSCD